MKMVGSQTNVPEWVQAAHAFTHASDREPFGIAILDAMSLGQPVVATTPGGPEEIITDGGNSVLIPYGEFIALAHSISRFLGDPALAKQCGAAAGAHALAFDGGDHSRRVLETVRGLFRQRSVNTAGMAWFPGSEVAS